jgi:hypothetical protein
MTGSGVTGRLPLWVTGGGLVQRGMFQHWLSKQTLCRCDCEPLECQFRTFTTEEALVG